jgi:formylglycine-generating enzyme required for sulfatase activity
MGSRSDEIAAAYDWCFELAGKECRKDVYEREGPPRPVKVSRFFLDRRERTVAEVAAWIRGLDGAELHGLTIERGGVPLLQVHSNPAPSPFRWERGEIVVTPGTESLPATMITHDGARAFCASLGRDLPTEAQWERAARGAEGRDFPWSELRPACADVVFGRGEKGACGAGGVVAVDAATKDLTPEGVAHMGGNVAEWVHDRFAPYEPCPGGDCRDPVVAPTSDTAEARVIRGGFAASLAEQTRSAGRSRQPAKNTIANVGFRCAAAP